jgi:hypothetical protein
MIVCGAGALVRCLCSWGCFDSRRKRKAKATSTAAGEGTLPTQNQPTVVSNLRLFYVKSDNMII